VITVGIQWFRRNPIKNELKQYPFAFVVNNYWLFLIAHIILHTTPAAIGDVIRMMQGRHAKLVTGSNHLYTVITQLTPFTSRQWQFLADNVDTKLLASMSEEDKNIFEIEVRKIDWEIYIITLVRARLSSSSLCACTTWDTHNHGAIGQGAGAVSAQGGAHQQHRRCYRREEEVHRRPVRHTTPCILSP
jgi:hypothetical protein